jgi:hypothetical protein
MWGRPKPTPGCSAEEEEEEEQDTFTQRKLMEPNVGQRRTHYKNKIAHGNDEEEHTTPNTRQAAVEIYTTDRQKTATILSKSM